MERLVQGRALSNWEGPGRALGKTASEIHFGQEWEMKEVTVRRWETVAPVGLLG